MKISDEAVEAAVLAAQAANPGGVVRGRHVQMRAALEAARPHLMPDREALAEIQARALEEAAEEIVIPGASSLAAAWLQGRATRLRNGSEVPSDQPS